MVFQFKLPDIAEGVHEGEIVAWHVKPGQSVKEDQRTVAEIRSAPLRGSPKGSTTDDRWGC